MRPEGCGSFPKTFPSRVRDSRSKATLCAETSIDIYKVSSHLPENTSFPNSHLEGPAIAEHVLSRLSENLLSDVACRWLLLDALFAGKYRCPHCQVFEERESAKARLVQGEKILCTACGRWWSPFNGTVLRGMQFSPGGLVLLVLLSQTELNQKQIAAALGCHPATVRTWLRKFGLRQDREEIPDQDQGPGLFNPKEELDR